MGKAHHTRAYREARIKVLTQRPPTCALADTFPDTCPVYIDYTLEHPHPWSATTEHLILASEGGDHTTLGVAHRHCQSRQGGVVATRGKWAALPPIKSSGVWD